MIFNCNHFCTGAETRELQGEMPLTLAGDGLWVGVLSSGRCVLQTETGEDAAGASGDLLLGFGRFDLAPTMPCHLLCLRLEGAAADAFVQGLSTPRFVGGAACPGAAELLARLCPNAGTSDQEDGPTAYALLCALAHADEEVRALSPLVAGAIAAIRDNYMALYGVEELSEQLGVSKCHLVRCFSAEMGISPGKYLIRTRIEAAKLLLGEREYNLEMIASLCGFSGANYLCRVFKRETGLSPAAWRESVAPLPRTQALPVNRGEIFV